MKSVPFNYPVSSDDIALAKQLHHEHCLLYGVNPAWGEVGNFGLAFWIRKAIRFRANNHPRKSLTLLEDAGV